MAIDKTTGRGCAWSIVSKTIAKRLIAEGIIGKTIFQKHRTNSKNRYTLTQVVKYGEEVYIVLRRNRDLAEEPLWIPSFIDERIWGQGVSSFSDLERLDINIERHLLPEMGEYLQSIPDAELVSITKGFLRGKRVSPGGRGERESDGVALGRGIIVDRGVKRMVYFSREKEAAG